MSTASILGIDIGGTKTAVSLGDTDGTLIHSRRMSSAGHDSFDVYMREVLALCDEVLLAAGTRAEALSGIGISAPGPLSVQQGVLFAPPNNAGWVNVPVVAQCEAHFGRPVWMNNDANAGVLAEYYFGEQKGCTDMLYVTCSTGIGGGVIMGGRLIQGASDMCGEIGHQILDPYGPLCGCGQRGCWEAFCGGLSVARRIQRSLRNDPVDTAILTHAGDDMDAIDFKAFRQAVDEQDAYALGWWEEYTERMAHGLGNLLMVLNPSVVMLGTIAVHSGDLLLDPVRRKLPRYAWSWSRDACEIVPATLGDRLGELCALAVARHAESHA